MQWRGGEISKLTDNDLKNGNGILNAMLKDLETKRANPAYKAKMMNQPPAHINPTFLELQKEISAEMTKRGLK